MEYGSPAMKFSHLIRINDPSNPSVTPLSRSQLWRGLVLRAEKPGQFVMGLDEVRILERAKDLLVRELHFGQARVRDTVRFEPMQQVRYDTEASAGIPAASLVMRIEEPEPEQLFVRFDYERQDRDGQPDGGNFYSGFLKNAYVETDLDTVRIIRRLVEQGALRDGNAN
jgi:hypothetical protein